MLNYSWKASPNRWGRPEFNATFSIGFGNGLDMPSVAYDLLAWGGGKHIFQVGEIQVGLGAYRPA